MTLLGMHLLIASSELRPQLEVVAFEVGTGGGNGPHQVHLVVGPN